VRHSAYGTDPLPMRKIAIIWVFSLSGIFSVTTVGQPASLVLASQGSTESISVPLSSTHSPTSKESTRTLIHRPSVPFTPGEPSESAAPSTSIRPSHSLIRRPSVPLDLHHSLNPQELASLRAIRGQRSDQATVLPRSQACLLNYPHPRPSGRLLNQRSRLAM